MLEKFVFLNVTFSFNFRTAGRCLRTCGVWQQLFRSLRSRRDWCWKRGSGPWKDGIRSHNIYIFCVRVWHLSWNVNADLSFSICVFNRDISCSREASWHMPRQGLMLVLKHNLILIVLVLVKYYCIFAHYIFFSQPWSVFMSNLDILPNALSSLHISAEEGEVARSHWCWSFCNGYEKEVNVHRPWYRRQHLPSEGFYNTCTDTNYKTFQLGFNACPIHICL